ncbi:mycothiol transferase, partial [Streptomyces sp. 900116325]
ESCAGGGRRRRRPAARRPPSPSARPARRCWRPEAEVPDWRDEDFRVDEQDTVKHWTAYFEEQVAISREITAGLSLEAPCGRPDLADRNLRWVLLHLIEETARHAGHADIIRESLDGSRGI